MSAEKDVIGYRKYLADALRGVLKAALRDVQRNGLHAGHQLWISFRTANMHLPDWLRNKYPEQMMIVLDKQFFIHAVKDDEFTVGLWFAKIPVDITIPFADLISFVDPWADFGLAFDPTPAVGSGPTPAMNHPAVITEAKPADIINLNDFRRTP